MTHLIKKAVAEIERSLDVKPQTSADHPNSLVFKRAELARLAVNVLMAKGIHCAVDGKDDLWVNVVDGTREGWQQRVDEVSSASGEHDVAHGLEDQLFEDFVRYVAETATPTLAQKAHIVLSSKGIKFSRHTA